MKPLKPGNQNYRGLSEFYAGRKIHRFQAEEIGIHALHSLVSSLEGRGLKFDRRTITVPTRWGADAHVTEYWLAIESFTLAARLLRLVAPSSPPQGDSARAYLLASRGGAA